MQGGIMKLNSSGRLLLAGLMTLVLAGPVRAAIGDNPVPVPSTFKTAHPRLPSPGSTYLTNLAANSTVLARLQRHRRFMGLDKSSGKLAVAASGYRLSRQSDSKPA